MEKIDTIKLLVICDNPDKLSTLSATVRNTLPEVHLLTATNDVTGINIAAIEDPDMILLDMTIPDVDSFEACRRFKSDTRTQNIPVVFLTTPSTDSTSRVKALDAGAEGFLANPLEAAELTAQIKTMAKVKKTYRSQWTEKDDLDAPAVEHIQELTDESTWRRLLMEQSRDGIVILDQDGQVYESNRKFAEMLGYPYHSITQLNVRDWEFLYSPERLMEMMRSVDERGDFFETRHRRKDGSVYDVEISTNATWFAGQKFIFCICRNITERKRTEEALQESEERFKALHNASFGGIAIHDQGVILDCNQGLSDISGFEQDELIGTDGLLLIAEQSRETVMAHIRSGYEKPYEAFGSRKNGAEYPLRLEAKNIPYQGKRVRVVEFRDITERKRTEEALQQKNQEMKQFVSIVSHDLKSPLVTVKAFADMLRQDLLNGEQQQINEDLDYIDKAADKMGQLLDALLQYSRIDTVDATAQSLAAGQSVEDCLAALAGILQQHQVQVSTSKLPQLLHGDPLHFGQIWQNLIENAVKYRGDQDQPQIEIGATQEGHEVVFYVRDNGMGIAPEHRERIFNLFSQLDPNSDGSGLGLALVKKIVSIYQGRIWVESAGEGRGSCFHFTLPGALVKDDAAI